MSDVPGGRPPPPRRPPAPRRPSPRPPEPHRRPPPEQRQQRQRDPYDYESIFFEDDGPEPSLLDRIQIRRLLPITGGVLGILLLLAIFNFVSHKFDPGGMPGNEVIVQVPRGGTLTSVSKTLQTRGVIPSALAMRVWAKIDGDAGTIRAGEYTFHSHESAGAALSVLRHGPKVAADRITIPEGFRISQIAERVGRLPGMSAQKFMDLAASGTVRSDFEPPDSNNLEGLLFPDTYLLSTYDNESTLLQRMVSEFDAQARLAGLDQSVRRVGHSPYETLIIASMIESEAKLPDDRGKVSQVIENRLFQGMPLQIDATVLYALKNTKQELTKDDLKIDSPYNTYKMKGLPAAPISNPGRASIDAALNPTPGPWLYYVLTGADGTTSFATTIQEQNQNIALARKRGLIK